MKFKELIRTIITFCIVGVLIGAIWILGSMDETKNTTIGTLDEDSESFLIDLADYIKGIETASSLTVAKADINAEMMDLSKYYRNGTLTDYMLKDLMEVLNDNDIKSVKDLLDRLNSEIQRLQNDTQTMLSPELAQARQVSIPTKTACQTYGDETMYCLDPISEQLNGYVIKSEKESKKWVLLLHGNTGNGKSIFNNIGDVYTDNGYNVLSPDLRGNGLSPGVSSWGYVDSLDAYDWIKWLHNNYDVDTLIIHGVSLGAAVGLQLATSPDYATILRNKYHFKGIIDDSGYTSIAELLKGLINTAGSVENGDIFNTLEYSVTDAFSDYVENGGLEDLITGGVRFEGIDDFINQYLPPDIIQPGNKEGKPKVKKMGEHYDVISYDSSYVMDESMARFFKEVIQESPMFGLDSTRYDTYADSFAENRNFFPQDNVLIIHSDEDEVIDPMNAIMTYRHAQDANTNFRYLWGVNRQIHAFILLNIKKTEYYGIVRDYLDCIENDNKCKEKDFYDKFDSWHYRPSFSAR